jgi:hypothetical protein
MIPVAKSLGVLIIWVLVMLAAREALIHLL